MMPERLVWMAEDKTRVSSIHERIVAIVGELPAIGKTQRNQQQGFNFRGHDDVLNALNPLLAKHGVIVVPNVVERVEGRRTTSKGGVMYEVNLHVSYTFYGAGGDCLVASAWGEGTDSGDKSTNKAMTMAFKNVLAQVFAVSTAEGAEYDTDRSTPEETVREFNPETDLMPGGVQPKDAARALNEMEPAVEWGAILDTSFEGWRELKGKEKSEFFRRLANAATWMQGVCPPGSFPPLTDEQIVAGFAFAFSGTVVEIERAEPAPLSTEQAAAADAVPDEVDFPGGEDDET